MQELMEWLDDSIPVTIKEQYLEKEKEQIVNAYDRGYKACDLDEALEINKTMFSGERYYEQTYNQDRIAISETKRSIEGIGLNNQNK
jgi:hypothetical protein